MALWVKRHIWNISYILCNNWIAQPTICRASNAVVTLNAELIQETRAKAGISLIGGTGGFPLSFTIAVWMKTVVIHEISFKIELSTQQHPGCCLTCWESIICQIKRAPAHINTYLWVTAFDLAWGNLNLWPHANCQNFFLKWVYRHLSNVWYVYIVVDLFQASRSLHHNYTQTSLAKMNPGHTLTLSAYVLFVPP